jgi:hypothetical protein
VHDERPLPLSVEQRQERAAALLAPADDSAAAAAKAWTFVYSEERHDAAQGAQFGGAWGRVRRVRCEPGTGTGAGGSFAQPECRQVAEKGVSMPLWRTPSGELRPGAQTLPELERWAMDEKRKPKSWFSW